jgi:hypothetical protein
MRAPFVQNGRPAQGNLGGVSITENRGALLATCGCHSRSNTKEIIELMKLMAPEVNGRSSTLSLGNLVEIAEKEKGVKVIGWAASLKRNGRWRIVFYYRDDSPTYQAAEWEYNPDQFSLYPFDLNNAPQFWSRPVPPARESRDALPGPAFPLHSAKSYCASTRIGLL